MTTGSNSGYLYFDDGAAWRRVNAQKLTDLTGTIDDIADGATYAKVLKADISAGHINKVSDGTNVKTAAEIKTHIDDVVKHRTINDAGTTITDLWSAQKIKNEIELAKHNIEPQASVKTRTCWLHLPVRLRVIVILFQQGQPGYGRAKRIKLLNTNLPLGYFMFLPSVDRLRR